MAVQNSLAKKRTEMFTNVQTATYEIGGQKIELTPEIVREYMVSGDKDRVSAKEVIMFMNLCKYSGLNPWAREAYCIKYGNEPATMVVGKEAYIKRAEANAAYDGLEAGIIVYSKNTQEIIHRIGSFRMPDEEIIGGWSKVWRKDREHPSEAEVSFEEYAGRKKDGSLNSQWAKKPATMIRKVALVQALKEAFPSSFGGVFSEEETEFVPEVNGDYVMTGEAPAAIEQRTRMQEVVQEIPQQEKEPVNGVPAAGTDQPISAADDMFR